MFVTGKDQSPRVRREGVESKEDVLRFREDSGECTSRHSLLDLLMV